MRMRRVGAQTGRARVPAEMMQFVPGIRHRHRVEDFGVGLRTGIDIDDGDGVRHLARRDRKRRHRPRLGRRLHGHAGGRIEGRVGCSTLPLQCSSLELRVCGSTETKPDAVRRRTAEAAPRAPRWSKASRPKSRRASRWSRANPMTAAGRARRPHSAFTPTAFTILPKRSVSDAMNAANSPPSCRPASAP